jgi:hypothetical protein
LLDGASHPFRSMRLTSGMGHFETKEPCCAMVVCSSLAPLAADTRPECVSLEPSLSSGRLHLLSLVRCTRALQDCSDRILAEPEMAADQPVAQTSLCQLEDLRRLAVRWTLSWLAAEASILRQFPRSPLIRLGQFGAFRASETT